MPVRLAHQSQAIQTVLSALQKDPRISRLYHPFVGNQQQQALAEKYLTGYGSLFAIDLKDTDFERLKTFVNALTLVTIGVSWGGFESLALPVFKGNNLAAVQKRGLSPAHSHVRWFGRANIYYRRYSTSLGSSLWRRIAFVRH